MRITLGDEHRKHAKSVGHPSPPAVFDCDDEHYAAAHAAWTRTLPDAAEEEIHKRTIAQLLWRHHANQSAPLPPVTAVAAHSAPIVVSPEIRIPEIRIPEIKAPDVHIPEIRIPEIRLPEIRLPNFNAVVFWLRAIFWTLILLCLLSIKAHCQFSHINSIAYQQGGVQQAFITYPHTLNFSGCTVVPSGSTITITCSTLPALPTSPNSVTEFLGSTPSGGVGGAATWMLPGLVGRAITGATASDTIGAADCNPQRVDYQGSAAVAVTLPTATTLGVGQCVLFLANDTVPAQNVTITPTTWQICNLGTCASSLVLAPGQFARLSVDIAGSKWDADVSAAGLSNDGNVISFLQNGSLKQNWVADEATSKAATCTVGNLACYTATNTVGDCGQGSTTNLNAAGVIVSCGPPVKYVDTGQVPVNSQASITAAAGHNACTDAANNGVIVDGGFPACGPTQKQIGIFVGDGGAGTSHVVTAQIGDAGTSVGAATNLNQIQQALASNTAGTSGNFNITWPSAQTGSTDFIDLTDSSASTGTGAKLGLSTLANSTAVPLIITQGNMTTAANPGTSAPAASTITTGNGGSGSSGANPGGAGGDVSITLGGAGQPSGTPNFHTAFLNQRNGAVKLTSGAPTSASIGGLANGSWLGGSAPMFVYDSPLIRLINPTASTSGIHQSFPTIQAEGGIWRQDAIASVNMTGASGGINYVQGDIVYTTVNSCSGDLLDVTSVSGGAITGIAIHQINGIPVGGLGCSATGVVNLTGGSGSGGQVNIASRGANTWGAIVTETEPVALSGNGLAYNTGAVNDIMATVEMPIGAASAQVGGASTYYRCWNGSPGVQGGLCFQVQNGGAVIAGMAGGLTLGSTGSGNIDLASGSNFGSLTNYVEIDGTTGFTELKGGNVLKVGVSDFTTASATLVTISGLSKVLPSVSQTVTFDCHLIYSEATANTAVVFGLQTATNGATNIAAGGRADVTTSTYINGALTGVASTTTSQNVISVTPSAAANTKLIADLWGTIEGTSSSGSTLNIMADIAGGITLTVYRGSQCKLF